MSEGVVTFYGERGGFSPKLFGPDRMSDALADYCKDRWPHGRRREVAKHFGLSDEIARTVCEGSASKATLEMIFRRAGWSLVLDIFARVLGEGVDQHFAREARRHAQIAEGLRSFAGGADRDHGARDHESGGRAGPSVRQVGQRRA